MMKSTVMSKGQTTLPKPIRQVLGVAPGDQVRYVILDKNEVRLLPARPLARLFGTLKHRGPSVALDDMERAVADGASDR